MKKLIIILLMAFSINASGQSKQVKVLLQQISALKTYSNYIVNGYRIVQKGLTTIGELKNGEFNLHKSFYDALATVNPKVSSYVRVPEIAKLLAGIINEREQAVTIVATGQFTLQDKQYVDRVAGRLSDDCDTQLELLHKLLTDNELEMDDAGRLKRIDQIYLEVSDNHAFARDFKQQLQLLSAVREREQRNINQSRELNAIPTPP